MGQNVKTKQGKQTNACKARAVDMERLFQFQQGHILALFKSQLTSDKAVHFLLASNPALTWKQTS